MRRVVRQAAYTALSSEQRVAAGVENGVECIRFSNEDALRNRERGVRLDSTRCVNDRDPGERVSEALTHVPPRQRAAKLDVGEHNINMFAGIEERNGDLARVSLKCATLGSAQMIRDHTAHEPFVLNYEHDGTLHVRGAFLC